MGAHLIDGEFQSDKYPTTPRGKVPLSVKDPLAQDLLWIYAHRREAVDAEFSDDLRAALHSAGYRGPTDDDLRVAWRAAGGDFHGPHVETGTMPEPKLLRFLRRLAAGYPRDSADMPSPEILHHGARGECWAAMFHYLPEGTPIAPVARAYGFELKTIRLEDETIDEGTDLAEAFDQMRGDVLELWNPAPPDGWALAGKWDTEDGALAAFIRPLPPGTLVDPENA